MIPAAGVELMHAVIISEVELMHCIRFILYAWYHDIRGRFVVLYHCSNQLAEVNLRRAYNGGRKNRCT